ncbi:hypothetical protein EJB05_47555, partial [Eragrostis curvula]
MQATDQIDQGGTPGPAPSTPSFRSSKGKIGARLLHHQSLPDPLCNFVSAIFDQETLEGTSLITDKAEAGIDDRNRKREGDEDDAEGSMICAKGICYQAKAIEEVANATRQEQSKDSKEET